MLYNVLKVETKGPDWKVVDVGGADGTTLIGASINRVDRKTNVPWAIFDSIVEGFQFEATPWTNESGKNYLFPPRPKTVTAGAKTGFNIAKAQEAKKEAIHEAQTNKNESIKISSTMRDAVALAIAEGKPTPENIIKWRSWLWLEWDSTDSLSTVPF